MFRKTLLAGLAVASLAPALATAQTYPQAQAYPQGQAYPQTDGRTRCLEQRHDNRVVGTIVGAGLGALLGNAIGQHGGKTGGTIIGGVGGAVAGNAIGAGTVNCGSNQYGYYDDNGRWVPNTATAYGFYDASGRWVDTSAPTYAPPGPTYAPPPAPQSGYAADRGPYSDRGPGFDRDHEHDRDHDRDMGRGQWAGAPADTRERESWLETRVTQRMAEGALDEWRGRHALRQLRDIRRMDEAYRAYDGRLSDDQRRDILVRLDAVRSDLWSDRREPGTRGAY